VELIEAGLTSQEIAARFRVSRMSANRWWRALEAGPTVWGYLTGLCNPSIEDRER
jgi:hypothetical protein